MGPRPRGRGWLVNEPHVRQGAQLQWGHGREAVDGSVIAWTLDGVSMLQWGHGREAVDGGQPQPPRAGRLASMGPRPRGRGWAASWLPYAWIATASMGPRPRGRGWLGKPDLIWHNESGLQWGHGREAVDGGRARPPGAPLAGFNGATAARPWMADRYALVRQTLTSFNGATAARPWMAVWRLESAELCRASMGPRPRGRGWRAICWRPIRARSRFNGATAARPWMGFAIQRPWTRLDCFNGATAARPWMGLRSGLRLRRGRRFNGATAARPWMAVTGSSAMGMCS